MSFHSRIFTHAGVRHVLIWLLALLLPMQATTAAVFNVMGPAHFHQSSEAPLVLTDFRRWHAAPERQTQAFASLGHWHGAKAQRHHRHASGDPSVVRTGQDRPQNSPEVDEGPSAAASLASVLAMIPRSMPWEPPGCIGTLASHAAWALLTGFDTPPDRPPMRG